jgi:hypothetical protein
MIKTQKKIHTSDTDNSASTHDYYVLTFIK